MAQNPNSHLELEYAELGENLRFYGDALFKWLTVFVAVTTALAGGSFQFEGVKRIAAGVGMALALAFLAGQRRYAEHWEKYFERAKEVEELLGLRQYRNITRPRVVHTTNVINAIYTGGIALWIIILTTT